MENSSSRRSSVGPLKPWKKGPPRGKGGPLNSTCEYRGVRQRTWGKWLPGDYTALTLTSTSPPSAQLEPNKFNKSHNSTYNKLFKWFPTSNTARSTGWLNLSAQPNVRVIHQRLQELQKNAILNHSSHSSSSSTSATAATSSCNNLTTKIVQQVEVDNSCEAGEKDIEGIDNSSEEMFVSGDVIHQHQENEKPQIDLHEFLQQMGIVKDGSSNVVSASTGIVTAESSVMMMPPSDHIDEDDDADRSNGFNWDTLIEMRMNTEIAQQNGSCFQVSSDVHEDLCFPTSIWNFDTETTSYLHFCTQFIELA
ncbi:hypothetical protein NMG60_11011823 [Bertholletia excelsa]